MGWVLQDGGVVGGKIASKPLLAGEGGLEQAALGREHPGQQVTGEDSGTHGNRWVSGEQRQALGSWDVADPKLRPKGPGRPQSAHEGCPLRPSPSPLTPP